MGAVSLHGGVRLQPKTDDPVRRLKLLEHDITALSGEAVMLEKVALDRTQEEKGVPASGQIATRHTGRSPTSAPPSRPRSPRRPPSAASPPWQATVSFIARRCEHPEFSPFGGLRD
jgi:hypothetical protein